MQKAFEPLPKMAFRDKYLAAIGVVVFFLCSFAGKAQIFVYPNPGLWGQGIHRFVPDSTFYFPTGCGAPSGIASLHSYGFTGSGQKIRQAAIYADTCGHHVYWFHWPDSSWRQLDGGGGGALTDSLTPTFIPYWDATNRLKNSPMSTTDGVIAIRGNTVMYFGGVGPHGSAYASFADTSGTSIFNIGEEAAVLGSGTPDDFVFFHGLTTGKTKFISGDPSNPNLIIADKAIRPFVGTSATRTSTPAEGYTYWDTDSACFVSYSGGAWKSLCSATIAPFTTTTAGIVTPAGVFNSRVALGPDNVFRTFVTPGDTTGKWVGYIGINGTNDSLIYFKGSTRFAVKIPVGGSAFDSAGTQGRTDWHSDGYNVAKYLQRGDSASVIGFVPRNQVDTAKQALRNLIALKKDISDSLVTEGYVTHYQLDTAKTNLRSLIGSGGFDSLTSQGGGFHTQPYNDVRYLKRSDSAGSAGFVTHYQDDTAKINLRARDTIINVGAWLKKSTAGNTKTIFVDSSEIRSNLGHSSILTPIGYMVTPKSFTNTHTITPGGVITATTTVDTVVLAGGANNLIQYCLANAAHFNEGTQEPSQLENYIIDAFAKVDSTPTATTWGIGIGKTVQAVGWVDCSTGANAGKLTISFISGSVDSAMIRSSTALTISQNDILHMTFQKQVDTLTFTVTDTTTAVTKTLSYVYPTSAYGVIFYVLPTTTGAYATFVRGGKYDITNFSAYSGLPRNPPLAMLGDSKAQGVGGSGGHDSTSAYFLDSAYTRCLNLGSSGDRTADILARIQEVLWIHPRQVIMFFGSNDIRNGVATATWQANYKKINDTLNKAGILTYHICAPERYPGSGAADMTALNAWLKATYPTTYINTYDAMAANLSQTINYANVHPAGIGHDTIFRVISRSGLILKDNMMGQANMIEATTVGYTMNPNVPVLVQDSGKIMKAPSGDFVGLVQKGGNPVTSTLQIGTTTAFDVDILRNSKKIVTITDAFPAQIKLYSKGGTNTGYLGVDSLNNTYVGGSMPLTATGSSNVFVGSVAGNSNTSGAFNTHVGFFAGRFNVSGQNNVNLGEACGYYNLGSTNTMVGAQCNFGSTTANIAGSVFNGFQAGYYETNSNRYQVSNSNTQNLLYGNFSTGQLRVNPGTNGTSPLTLDASAQFEITSTTRGMLIPRMTTAQMNAISSPTTGLIVWNSDSLCMVVYNGTAWRKDSYSGSGGIGSLNSLSGASQTFATGTSGTDFGISSSGTTHTFNIPDANGTTARGFVSTGSQTFGGVKTFLNKVVFAPPTTSLPSFNLPSGTFPTSPSDGDMGHVSGHLYFRDGSTTYDLLSALQFTAKNGLYWDNSDTSIKRGGSYTQRTVITGGSNSLFEGTSGSKLDTMEINANTLNLNGTTLMNGFPVVVAIRGALETGQTSFKGQSRLLTADTYCEAGGYILVNSITTNHIWLEVTFTDPGGTARTIQINPVGTPGTDISTPGYYLFPNVTFRAKSGTNVGVQTNGTTGGSMNYDWEPVVKQIRL